MALEQLTAVSAEFLQAVKKLDPKLCEKDEVCGRWAVKGLVSHMIGWEIEAKNRFQQFAQGPSADIKYDIDSFNRQSVNSRNHLPWPRIMAELEYAQQELSKTIKHLDEEAILREKRYQSWVNTLINHYKHHLKQIKNLSY